jgi:hypothetical protein
MKTLFTLIIAIAIPYFAISQNLDHLDKKKGYKSIRLEDTISNINNNYLRAFAKPSNDGITYFHYSEDNAVQFSDSIKLKDIVIAFYENKVYSINLYFNRDQGQPIKDIFDRAYGDGLKVNDAMDDYYYNGDIAALEIHYGNNINRPVAIFTSAYLHALYYSRKNESDKKAAKDL